MRQSTGLSSQVFFTVNVAASFALLARCILILIVLAGTNGGGDGTIVSLIHGRLCCKAPSEICRSILTKDLRGKAMLHEWDSWRNMLEPCCDMPWCDEQVFNNVSMIELSFLCWEHCRTDMGRKLLSTQHEWCCWRTALSTFAWRKAFDDEYWWQRLNDRAEHGMLCWHF